jgi:hypothetical protein
MGKFQIFAAVLLLALSAPHALFLVGEGKVGQRTSVLCEGQENAFVSSPDGQTLVLPLDASFQASFSPQYAGPHSVQCGKEAKVVLVAGGVAEIQQETAKSDWLILALVLIFVCLLAVCAAFIVREFILFPKGFAKKVDGGKVELFIRSPQKLEHAVVDDPGLGKPLEIGTLQAGREWKWSYESAEGERHLPAELVAMAGGKKIRMLSELQLEGKEDGRRRLEPRVEGDADSGAMQKKGEDAGKRPLPKA